MVTKFKFLKYAAYFYFLCLLFLMNCSEAEKEESVFNIDSTQIGRLIIDSTLGINFHPPLKWISAQSEVSDKITRQMTYARRTFIDYIYSTSNLFYKSDNGSVLNIGEVNLRKNDSTMVPVLYNYLNQSTRKFKDAEVKTDNITINNINFTRLEIHYGVWYTYRLVFNNKEGKLVQFEYSTQQKYEPKEKLSIESSVRTIKFL